MAYALASIERINTLFSLLQQVNKDTSDVVQLRNLTNFHRHAQYRSFLPVNRTKFLSTGVPSTQARLGKFIGERTEGADYTKYLNLIAMLHEHFKKFSDLMEQQQKRETCSEVLPSVDRIIIRKC